MRIPRIYQAGDYHVGDQIELDAEASAHLIKVLRRSTGQPLELFNGDGHNYAATLEQVSKKFATARIIDCQRNTSESPLSIHLAQGISRGDRMDFVLQKSVELGVSSITPLFTERCGVKLNGERLDKKLQQWQKIVIAACEQSGRSFVPEVRPAVNLAQWFIATAEATRFTLDPHATKPLREVNLSAQQAVHLLIGPEGGFSDIEVEQATQQHCIPVRLWHRILLTETAALTALAVLNYQFGDLG